MKKISIILATIFFASMAYGQCLDDNHSPFSNTGWVSCQKSANPNINRGESNWIMYDFGSPYVVEDLYIWNHNVWGETGFGIKTILVDYSLDKVTWNTAGPFTIAQAPGSWKYTGVEGPKLNKAHGRYFIITVVDAWDNSSGCVGFGEIKFNLGDPISDVEDVEFINVVAYPNPASEVITIKYPDGLDDGELIIRDALGRDVYSSRFSNSTEQTLNLSNYVSGIYYANIKSDDGRSFSTTFMKR